MTDWARETRDALYALSHPGERAGAWEVMQLELPRTGWRVVRWVSEEPGDRWCLVTELDVRPLDGWELESLVASMLQPGRGYRPAEEP